MHATQTRPSVGLQTLAIFAGGADRLDGVLEHVVAPAIGLAAPERWWFVRWNGDGGPHVRLALGGDGWTDARTDELAERIGSSLARAAAGPAREPLLRRPASHRTESAYAGVRRIQTPREELPSGALDQISSEVALDVLPELEDGRARCAYGLSLMATISQAALGHHSGPELWRDAARRRTKTDARGQRLLASLTGRAGLLGAELVEIAHELRRDGATADGLARFAEAFRELSTPAAVRQHAHMTCNRLGVTPLEEALLALVLSGAGGPPGPPGRTVVELERVTKRQDERAVLDELSLTVREGEVFALLGPKGAGKSSVLGITAGLRLASAGSVRVFGRDPRDTRREHADTRVLAMPDAELAEERTARENVELHSESGSGGADVEIALEEVGLHEQAGTVVADLNAGQRRRLVIACALVHRPALLLLDEPTAGLSPVDRDEVWRVVGRRRERGATTIIGTTSLQEALCACDRAALILDGSLRAVGTPARLADEFFSEGVLHFHVVKKPDRALLEELPEVHHVEVDERADHWAIEIATRQPRELLALLEADPEFPEILNVDEESLNAPLAAGQEA